MIQTGNLKQFSTNLILNTKLSNSNFESNINASFQYVKVNDFNVINDFWSYGYFKYHQTKRLYPIGMVYGGFAKSFGINSSFLGGAGLGLNIIQKSPQKFLHLNVIAGYMNFDYFTNVRQEGGVMNAFIQGNTRIINERLNLSWEVHLYKAFNNNLAYGIQNQIRIGIPITKWLEIGISNTVNFNETVDLGKQKLNSMTLVGLKILK